MPSSLGRRLSALALMAVLGASCSGEPTGVGVPGGTGAPDSLSGHALGLHLVILQWTVVPNVTGYRIERRSGNEGEFATLTDVLSPTTTTYSDPTVEPETSYGYRVRGLTTHGDPGGASIVVGIQTPPVPGIAVSFQIGTPGLEDVNGYMLTLTGGLPDTTIRTPVLPTDSRRFSPLSPGSYLLALSGLSGNCSVDGGPTRNLEVTDQGTQTLTTVPLQISCRDPDVGRLQAQVTTTGDSLDLDGYILTLSGVASDTGLPDSARAYFRRDTVGVQASTTYEGLRPGDYTLKLTGVAGNCTVSGSATLTIPVAKLDDLARSFSVSCQASVDPTKPVVWQSQWLPPMVATGQPTKLDVGLDLSRAPTQAVTGAQALLLYDAAVVRLDSARAASPWQASFNTSTAGRVNLVAFVVGTPVVGSTSFAHLYFTAIGTTGATTTTSTTIFALADGGGASIISQVRKAEGTFEVGSGGGGNQSPVAHAGGPYAGTAGTAVSFNGSTSSDPDGTIATYAWTFGDGASATGATPGHSYAAAGSYTVGLTVTDNAGGTNHATTTATITAGGGGGNQPPVARAGGPYGGLVGTPMQFDGSSSSDADGSVATYAWTFGDGGTATGASPTHVYPTAGSYPVSLTVTDNQGATGQATTTATASAGTGHPFTWQSSFGPVNPADSLVALTITLDLSTDIAETQGPEALQNWTVDSLKWNPAVLSYYSFNFGAGGGSVNPTDAAAGLLSFHGTQSSAANSGVVPIATIRFKVIGASGSSTQTTTALGPLLGTPATGSFSYGSRTAVVESGVQAP